MSGVVVEGVRVKIQANENQREHSIKGPRNKLPGQRVVVVVIFEGAAHPEMMGNRWFGQV